MSHYGYARLDSMHSSTASSTYTSPAVLTGAAATMSLSIISNVAGATSLWTVQATNAEGNAATIAELQWSTVTAIPAQGFYTLDPGARWMRLINPSNDSLSTVDLNRWDS